MHSHHVTRGFGLLDSLLAKLRAKKADSLILSKLRDGRILDIGCGSFPYFLLNTTFKEKYGLDSSVAVDSFVNQSITIKKMNAGAGNIPFKNGFFNCITMLAVFEHIDNEEIPDVLKEVKRLLSENGSFIMTTPSPWSDNLLWMLSRIGLISKVEIDDHKHTLSSTIIKKLLREAGFVNIKSGYFEFGCNMWFTAQK